MLRNGRIAAGHPPRGTVIAFTAVVLVFWCGFAALTLDVGDGCIVQADAEPAIMDRIAGMGSGEHIHAEGILDQCGALLERFFSTIGGRRSAAPME